MLTDKKSKRDADWGCGQWKVFRFVEDVVNSELSWAGRIGDGILIGLGRGCACSGTESTGYVNRRAFS